MTTSDPPSNPNPAESWRARQEYWRRKLGRLRLGMEPLEDQFARIVRATIALTVVTLFIALMFVALFSAFRRPDIGLIIGLLFFVPIAGGAWLDVFRLERRAAAYQRELHAFEQKQTQSPEPGPSTD